MIKFVSFFLYVIYFLGLLSFSINRSHLLLSLLSLEFIVLSLFVIIYMYMIVNFEFYFNIVFLSFAVCEGVIGLSVLISLIRTHGNDYFQSFSILVC
uniref:NADH-ubiquinone oxidoreductase chain 4L n=1 Tax=Priacma serrata TaxID=50550 RepID=A0A0S2MQR0_PRISE|nr:NADH deshydrogenase subunit 4L [Priacma serrata]